MPIDITVGANSERVLEEENELGPGVHFVRYRSPNRWVRLGVEIPQIIREHRIDYAHFQYFCPVVKNCRWIVTIHDLLFNDFPEEFPRSYRLLRNGLFRYSARRADVITTVSEYSRDSLHKHYGIPADRVVVLPNGVATQFFNLSPREDAAKRVHAAHGIDRYVLYVSRLEPRKNHIGLARAFYELELDRRGYKLVFVGHRSLAVHELDRYLRQLPFSRRAALSHFEAATQAELMDFYRAADLFVYPSRGEGFGIPPLEAIAMGTPTLCANVTAMADFQFLGEGLFSPADSEELKRKMLKVINHGVSSDYSDTLRQTVREQYSWDLCAKRLASIILRDVARD